MTSKELADKVLSVCWEASKRIEGIGDEQYNTEGVQKHEVETLGEHLQGLEEELLDTINHAAMSVLKIRSLREKADRTIA